jgi:hypothetical protein
MLRHCIRIVKHRRFSKSSCCSRLQHKQQHHQRDTAKKLRDAVALYPTSCRPWDAAGCHAKQAMLALSPNT